MQYTAKEPDRDTAALIRELEPVTKGMGFSIVELSLFRSGKGNARIRLVAARDPESKDPAATIGTDELSRLHRAIVPRLELALEGRDLYIEVSSPGTDRLLKSGTEFRFFKDKAAKCWLKGADAWERGILRGSDTEKILLETGEGIKEMKYETIAKAKLDG